MNLIKSLVGFFGGGFVRPWTTRAADHKTAEAGDDGHDREVTEASALGLSAAWACVNLIAGTIGSLPCMVYRTGSNGARSIARDHPLYRVLHDSPNFDQTAVDVWEYGAAALELRGNMHARIERAGGRVVALFPIYERVTPRYENGAIRYRWTEDGRAFDLPQQEVFHVRGFGGNPLGGLSTLAFARHTFGLAQDINRAARQTFRNGMRPSGTLTFDKFLTDAQRDLAEKRLVEKFVGAMNAGRPMVLEGGTKWEALTINPEDAQMLQSRGFSVEEICRFFGVPPHMVGHTEKATSLGTGLEQQTLGFQKFTLRRRIKRIEQAAQKQLLTPADRAAGITVEFNLEGLLRGDSKARSEFYQSALTNGWMTINEVRAIENLPPVEGGEIPRMQMQNVPITEAGRITEIGRRAAVPALPPA